MHLRSTKASITHHRQLCAGRKFAGQRRSRGKSVRLKEPKPTQNKSSCSDTSIITIKSCGKVFRDCDSQPNYRRLL